MLRCVSSLLLSPGRLLVFCAVLSIFHARSEVIYDNTTTYLGGYATEKLEYGDQLDLGGTARILTDLAFEYFGEFAQQGDEAVTVRLYTNEQQYDQYRKAPTRLIFESGLIPLDPGFNTRRISGLHVELPLHTVTFTVEFSGLAENETAGLLFYSPPTTGYSFNEFWRRTPEGKWQSILYSTTNPARRANAALRLTAVPEPVLDQVQSQSTAVLHLLDGSSPYRFAQTFTPQTSGRLDRVTFAMASTNAPVQVRLRDTLAGAPGPNTLGLGAAPILDGSMLSVSFYDQNIHLKAGTKYALEFSAAAPLSESPGPGLQVTSDKYPRGDFWWQTDGGPWSRVLLDPSQFADAQFGIYIVPAEPPVTLQGVRPLQEIDSAEPIALRASVRLPDIGTVSRVRYFNSREEIGSVAQPPYEFVWTNAPSGEIYLQAVVEDSFRRLYRSERVYILVRVPGPPANDNFANRIVLEGSGPRAMKPTATATLEPGEPRVSPDTAGASLWWSWTAFDSNPVFLTVQNGRSTNATIGVFAGDTLTNLVPITQGAGALTFVPVPGRHYSLVVDPVHRGEEVVLDLASADIQISRLSPGAAVYEQTPVIIVPTPTSGREIVKMEFLVNGSNLIETTGSARPITNVFARPGFFEVQLAATDSRGLRTLSAARPITIRPRNDSWKAPAPLGSGLTGSILATTLGATAQSEDLADPAAAHPSVWFQWQAPAAGPVTFSVNEGATLRVFRPGPASEPLQPLSATSAQTTQFTAWPGESFLLVVSTEATDSVLLSYDLRPFQLHISTEPALTVHFDSVANQRVQLEASADLETWTVLGDSIEGTGQRISWNGAEILPPGEAALRFFRVRIAPEN